MIFRKIVEAIQEFGAEVRQMKRNKEQLYVIFYNAYDERRTARVRVRDTETYAFYVKSPDWHLDKAEWSTRS